ncbi:penicillin-binding protein 1C [Chitinimonas sp.]|uniref:penicillin-binding protein 1C n=1 Tax=Chitinimonas sp. TaxID=1934313 RepID=UPI0035AF8853
MSLRSILGRFKQHLTALTGKKPNRWRWLFGSLFALLLTLLLLDRCFPLPVRGQGADFAAVVLARDGTPLRAFADARHVWRYPVRIEQVSPRYVEALIRYEDRAYWWHPGINPLAMLRAAGQWLRAGRVVSGGSTLTMQVARIIDPVPPRTVSGKLRQTLRALQLELHYSKREILTIYLNYAPMGGVLEGVEAASRAYLGKPSSRLTHAEAALLAVLPQMPSRLRPDRFQSEALLARNKVLGRMQGKWSPGDIHEALNEPMLALKAREPKLAPLLANRLHQALPGQAKIDSTIDADAQRLVELLLADRLSLLPPRVSAAALVVDNRDMSTLAYAGSVDFADKHRFAWVDMVRGIRSPGSTLKPFLYAMALDEGLIHTESLLIDAPQSFSGYAPGNFGQAFSGPVSASEALVRSLNVPAVQVLDHLSAERFVAKLRQGGLPLTFPRGAKPNLSVILGGAGTNLEALVGSYRALARGGMAGQPRFVRSAPLQERQLMSAGAAYIVRSLLEGGGPTAQAVGVRPDRRGVAFKTGTSYGFRDAWTVGVSERYTVGVWIGRPDGTPNPGFYGANVAQPLLQAIFNGLPAEVSDRRSPPASVSQSAICWPEGRLAEHTPAERCQQRRLAWLLNQTAPPTLTGEHDSGDTSQQWFEDPRSGERVMPDCAPHGLRSVTAARWPTLLQPWLDDTSRRASLPPPWSSACTKARRLAAPLHIRGAVNGELIVASPSQPAPLLRLSTQGGSGTVQWLVNGRLQLAALEGGRQIIRLQEAGSYAITAIDEDGNFDRIRVRRR